MVSGRFMFNNLYGVSSCVWEQMDTGRHVYFLASLDTKNHFMIMMDRENLRGTTQLLLHFM